jgi:hypothetical protein
MTREERRSHWKHIVDDQAASGLEVSVFCRKHKIKIPQFYRWRSKFQDMNHEEPTAAFIQLIPGESSPDSGIRVRIFDDLFIEVDRGFDPVTLRTAVETLYSRG